MNIGEIIKRFRDKNGITQQTFADNCGVSKSYISLLESGKSSRSSEPIIPSIDVAHRMANYMNISIDSLFDSVDGKQPVSLLNEPIAESIPVLGRVPAGIPLEAIECIIDYEEIPVEMARTGEFFGLQIEGDSMAPRILDGDVVIVRKQPTIESGDIAIVMVNGDDATCKRVMYHENGLSLVSNNPAYQPRYFTAQEVEKMPIQIIGKVVELRGKF
ncbi:MAG: XRE family transcriptional regulator [Eubacteriales bacterium]|mgnify:CR=1 FL=1|nr:XRE family transcriptional regulator [Eubacteriales bacterium]